jgi:hypothetical protein
VRWELGINEGRAQEEQENFIEEGMVVCRLMSICYLGWLVVSILVWIREEGRMWGRGAATTHSAYPFSVLFLFLSCSY